MSWPVEFGGQAASHVDRLVVTEELLRQGAPVAAHWVADRQIGPAILAYGTESLQRQYLPAIAAGTAYYCLGMSEPDAGSDLASVTTRATKVLGGWRVHGRKIWTSHAHRCTHAYLLVRTGERGADKHDGLTEMLTPMDVPGISVHPIPGLDGSHHFNELVLEDVFVPDDHILGTPGDGWQQVTRQLSFERGGAERVLSTYPLLSALLAEPAVRADEGAQRELGSLISTFTSLRWLYRRVAEAMDADAAPVGEAAAAKYLGTRFEKEVLQVVRKLAPRGQGAIGRLRDLAIQAAPSFGIRGGAEAVLLSIIAKQEFR
jgi:alkylation response protein AidB-like acyl-CoA dehydrogenase